MVRLKSLRRRHIAIAVLLLVMLQAFAVLVSGLGARANSVDSARDAIRREGNTVVESILRHLDPAEHSVDVTTRLLSEELIDTSSPGLEQYLFTQLAVLPQMTGAFVGFPDESFVFVSLDGDGFQSKRIETSGGRDVEVRTYDENFELTSVEEVFDDTFEPTVRPWYESAVAADELTWTDPYVFFSSQQPGVTASRAVRVDGDVVAVVGVDVELSGLSAFLDDLAVAEDGEAFVTSGDNVIGAPSRYADRTAVLPSGDVELLRSDALGIDLGEGAVGDVVRVESDGADDLVLKLDLPESQGLAWSVVIRAPETAFTDIANRQQMTAVLITVGGGFLVLAAILVLLRTTRPLEVLEEAASTDPLTGLANRRTLYEASAVLCDELTGDQQLSVLAIDLDRFKALNDSAGHLAGDNALRSVADVLRSGTRPGDLVGRLGGDEFVVVHHVDSVDAGIDRAQRLLTSLSRHLADEFPHADLGATGGLTICEPGNADFAKLLIEADAALIAAKDESKGMLRLSERLVRSVL